MEVIHRFHRFTQKKMDPQISQIYTEKKLHKLNLC